jgi:hypothetical protein
MTVSSREVTGHLLVTHRAARLVFDVGQPYERFVSRYEAVVPALNPRRPGESDGRHARWHVYRHDPAIMLYAPLRTLIYIDAGDRTRFAVDQSSTVLASFAHPAVAALGRDLDGQLADLLDALGVEAGPLLRTARTVLARPVRKQLDLYPNAG